MPNEQDFTYLDLLQYCFLNPNRCFQRGEETLILKTDLSITVLSGVRHYCLSESNTRNYITLLTNQSIYPIDYTNTISLQCAYIKLFCDKYPAECRYETIILQNSIICTMIINNWNTGSYIETPTNNESQSDNNDAYYQSQGKLCNQNFGDIIEPIKVNI